MFRKRFQAADPESDFWTWGVGTSLSSISYLGAGNSKGINFATLSARACLMIPQTHLQLAILGQDDRLVNLLKVHFGIEFNRLCVQESTSIAADTVQNLPGAAVNISGK
jgi:hypothetical protein